MIAEKLTTRLKQVERPVVRQPREDPGVLLLGLVSGRFHGLFASVA